MKTNDGGPAFPIHPNAHLLGDLERAALSGMSLRVYAAIKLQVPESGIDWLDEIIVKHNRDKYAAMALNGLVSWQGTNGMASNEYHPAQISYKLADAMLAEREKATSE